MKESPGPGRKPRLTAYYLLAALLALAGTLLLAEGAYRVCLFINAGNETGVFELYAIGESSMEGVPFKNSPPKAVYGLLDGKLGGKTLRVVNFAAGGNSIYPQALKIIKALKFRNRNNPGVLLIYGGHNEQLGMEHSHLFLRRLSEWFKTRLLIHSCLLSEPVFELERRFEFFGPRDLAHYEFYLRAAIEAAVDSGLTPVISTLASNDADLEPSLRCGGPRDMGGVHEGVGLETGGKYGPALARYKDLYAKAEAAGDACMLPYLDYRIGKCYLALGDSRSARTRLMKAVETDPVPLRAVPAQNRVIRKLAAEYGIPLLDAEKLFADKSALGVPGKDLFIDHVHPTAAGYALLSRAFAGSLAALTHGKVSGPEAVFDLPRGDGSPDADPYTLSGVYVLWIAQSGLPMPDRLALSEKNFRKALAISGTNNLAAIGLRIVRLSKKNRYMMPQEVYDWLRGQRAYFAFCKPFPKEELRKADNFLNRWE